MQIRRRELLLFVQFLLLLMTLPMLRILHLIRHAPLLHILLVLGVLIQILILRVLVLLIGVLGSPRRRGLLPRVLRRLRNLLLVDILPLLATSDHLNHITSL